MSRSGAGAQFQGPLSRHSHRECSLNYCYYRKPLFYVRFSGGESLLNRAPVSGHSSGRARHPARANRTRDHEKKKLSILAKIKRRKSRSGAVSNRDQRMAAYFGVGFFTCGSIFSLVIIRRTRRVRLCSVHFSLLCSVRSSV